MEFLDYIWRGLTVGAITSFMTLAVLFFTAWVIDKKASRQQMKYFFHSQIVLIASVFVGSFLWVVCVDPELASGCFSAFAKDQSFFTLTRLFAAMWGVGFVGLGVYDLLRIFKSGADDLKVPAHLRKQFSQLVAVMNVPAPVELYVSEKAISPYAEGLQNPRVVLPRAVAAMPPENLRHILAHELVHIRDRDSAWKAFELFTRRLLFFNPFMYVLAQKHLLAIEKAADEEAVLKTKSRAQDYIQTLIEVVSQHRTVGGNPLALNASKTFKETKARMESLVLAKTPPKKNFVNAVIFASVLASVGMSVAQARSTVRESAGSGDEAMMCLQVHHEQIIESWLSMKPETNRCE